MTEDQVLLETPRFRVVRRSDNRPESTKSAREVILHPGAVTIVPMVDDGHVCLIRNHRVAVRSTLLELPAGTLESGEPPEVACVRELREETGYTAKRWQQLPAFWVSPGILAERMHLFVARELVAGPPARESGEEIENYVLPWDEAMRLVESGAIEDAKTMVGLMLYDRIRRAET